jgi:site-specific DNA-methyltransferase (adenine-specific)
MRTETIGNATLHLGDCMEVLATIKAMTVDAIVTDPPYSTPTVASFGRKVVRRLSDLAIQEFYFAEVKKQASRILKESAPVLVFCDDAYYPVLFSLFYEWQQTNLLIWDKGKFGMGNPFRRQHELIFYANRTGITLQDETSAIPTVMRHGLTKAFHGAEKPVELLERLIAGLTPKDGVVLDPFMGSASTGVAAIQAGRKFVGVEMDPEYFDIACDRINATYAQGRLFA